MRTSSAKRALHDLRSNILSMMKVVAAATLGVAVLVFISGAKLGKQNPYDVSAFVDSLAKVNSEETPPDVSTALKYAASNVERRGKEFESRDDFAAALIAEVITHPNFPKVKDFVAAGDRTVSPENRKAILLLQQTEDDIEKQQTTLKDGQSDLTKTEEELARAQRQLVECEAQQTKATPTKQRVDTARANDQAAVADRTRAEEAAKNAKARLDAAEALAGGTPGKNPLLDSLRDEARATENRLTAAIDRAERTKADLKALEREEKDIQKLERAVDAAQHSLTVATAAAAKKRAEVNAALLDLDSLVRKRNFAADHLNLELATLRDRQQRFLSDATLLIDKTIKARKDALEAEAKSSADSPVWPRLQAVVAKTRKAENPYHVLYEGLLLFCAALIVLGIAFAAATILKVLHPSAAEKWSGKMEDLAEKVHPAEGSKSPAASLLVTVATLGIGVGAVAHVMREPRSVLSDAADSVPFMKAESPVSSASALSAAAQYASLTLPAYGSPSSSLNPTIAVTPAPISFSPLNQIQTPPVNVPPVQLNGLDDDVRKGITNIGVEAQETRRVAERVEQAFNTEGSKAESLRQSVEQTDRALDNLSWLENTEASLTRSDLDYLAAAGKTRQLLFARQDALNGTHRWWRSLLALQKYQVTEGTLTLFGTESLCKDEDGKETDLHRRLREALPKMKDGPSRYEAPFEMAVIWEMNGSYRVDDPNFQNARKELRRHLPLILQASRTAE